MGSVLEIWPCQRGAHSGALSLVAPVRAAHRHARRGHGVAAHQGWIQEDVLVHEGRGDQGRLARRACLGALVKGPEAIVTKTAHLNSVVSVVSEDLCGVPVDLHILPSAQCVPKDRFMPPLWCCASATVDQTAIMALSSVQPNALESVLPDE